ncbi:UL16-binding protein 6-like, partial [Malaclemys terrapin pileata]|uniref:UL16-binding protein 6-like n=1 Tax=Malaclemys terrapin pileata TaxID=2991368 RepID=UPI0023A7D55C
SLCSATSAGVHYLSYLQLIIPQAAPGLPKRLNVERMNDLVLSANASKTSRLAPHHGYMLGKQETDQFWRVGRALCLSWDSWVETKYQALVLEMNSSSPKTEPYYIQVLHSCELDDATGVIRAITRYSLNGEDVLQHKAEQNRWFSVHPVAWQVAERWNREGETFALIHLLIPQRCRFWIESFMPFITEKTGDSSSGASQS